ncbi:hypothetical protein ANN_17266 [Periplaneta americana]|uniref:Uncharacterized protein n=1 Tax=Periplaneta americana TaxID=6978 RepID=A0ABQ8STR4_PERAM|nr:hypothetical protein ANN_17266 [Periplaneta americana]
MDLREVRYDDRDWINLAQDRDQWRAYVRAAMNLRVPLKPVIKYRFGTMAYNLPESVVSAIESSAVYSQSAVSTRSTSNHSRQQHNQTPQKNVTTRK